MRRARHLSPDGKQLLSFLAFCFAFGIGIAIRNENTPYVIMAGGCFLVYGGFLEIEKRNRS